MRSSSALPVMGTNSVGTERFAFELAAVLAQAGKRLLVTLADGNDHQAAVAELVDERLRNFFRRAGDDDLVERRVLGPA